MSFKSRLSRELKYVGVMAIFLPILPLLILNFLILGVYHYGVILVAKIFRPDLDRPMPAIQAGMAIERIHTKPKLNIVVTCRVQGEVTVKQTIKRLQDQVLSCTDLKGQQVYKGLMQFKSRFLGYYFWKYDLDFQLGHHVREYDYYGDLALSPGATDTDLERVTGGLIAQTWKKGRSPWEVLLVSSYGLGKDETLIILRLHHSMGDGYSILKLLLQTLDTSNVKRLEPNFPKLNSWEKFAAIFIMPLSCLYYIAVSLVDGTDGNNSWHLIGEKMSSDYNTCFVEPIPVKTLKKLKSSFNVNYNAVLGTLVCQGIRRLMEAAGQQVPKEISVMVPMPMPNHPQGLVVHAGGFHMKWPLKVSSESIMKEINAQMNIQNASGQLIANNILVYLIQHFPEFLGRLCQSFVIRCTMAFSTFPAPQLCPTYYGHGVSDVMFAMGTPSGKMGATLTLLSFGVNQRIALTVDKKIYGELDKFSTYVHQELDKMIKIHEAIV